MARFTQALVVALSSLVAIHLISQDIGGSPISPRQEDNDSPAGYTPGEPRVLPVAHCTPVPQPLAVANAAGVESYAGRTLLRRLPPVAQAPLAGRSDGVPQSSHTASQPSGSNTRPPTSPNALTPSMNAFGHPSRAPAALPANALTPADWLNQPALAAVATQADSAATRAFALAEKGALYSARSELERALGSVSQAVDAYSHTSRHTEALREGLQALKEAGDFSGAHRSPAARIDVETMVATHRTPVLKTCDVSQTPAVVAMQHYYTFAQERLAQAASGAPAASRLLYGLGKIHVAMSERSSSTTSMHGPKAMAFHQAAVMADPTNYRAANELGVLLARFGQLQEARSVLQHSIRVRPAAETWHNLSMVHERLGEQGLAQRARYELSLARQQVPAASATTASSLVQWVDPRTFSTMGYVGAPAPLPAHAAPPPKTAEKPSPFWTW